MRWNNCLFRKYFFNSLKDVSLLPLPISPSHHMMEKLVAGTSEGFFSFAVSSPSIQGLNMWWQKEETPLQPFAPLPLQERHNCASFQTFRFNQISLPKLGAMVKISKRSVALGGQLLGAQGFLADPVGVYTLLGLLGFGLLLPRKSSAEALGQTGKIVKEIEHLPGPPCSSTAAGRCLLLPFTEHPLCNRLFPKRCELGLWCRLLAGSWRASVMSTLKKKRLSFPSKRPHLCAAGLLL